VYGLLSLRDRGEVVGGAGAQGSVSQGGVRFVLVDATAGEAGGGDEVPLF